MLNIVAIETSLFLLSFIGIIINSLCIYIVRVSQSLKAKASSLLILNLLVLHLCQSIFVFPFYALKKLKFSNLSFTKFVANGWRFSYMLSFYGTVFSVLFISLDRVLAVYLLNKYKTFITKKRVKIAIFFLWTYIITFCCIPFIPDVKSRVSNYSNITYIKPQKYVYVPQKVWVVFMLSFNTLLPYILILLCYVYITLKLYKIKSQKDKELNESPATLHMKKDSVINSRKKDLYYCKRMTKLTLVLSLAYGVFWSPSVIYYIILETCLSCFFRGWDGSNTEQHVGFIVKYLAFMDAIAAPLIYCFLHGKFRKELQLIRKKIMLQENSDYNEKESTGMVRLCFCYLTFLGREGNIYQFQVTCDFTLILASNKLAILKLFSAIIIYVSYYMLLRQCFCSS